MPATHERGWRDAMAAEAAGMMADGHVLVLGAGGLLGSAFVTLLGRDVRTASRNRLKPATADDIARLLDEHAPALVINCAADVDAEGAEVDDSVAIAANVMLPRHLARACADRRTPLIQFSSTGCYGDWKDTPFVEDDPLRPTTRHHRTKAMGEEEVRRADVEHLIVRTGWLYGGEPGRSRNFVWQRLVEASRTDRIVSDGHQRGCPTRVDDVARQVLHAYAAGIRHTINVVAQGSATRADYVAQIVEQSGLRCRVEPGPAFKRLAPVSFNETAVNARLAACDVDIMPCWGEGVRAYVATLMHSPAWTQISGN